MVEFSQAAWRDTFTSSSRTLTGRAAAPTASTTASAPAPAPAADRHPSSSPMAPLQQQLVLCPPQTSFTTQKVQLIYKLFLLENARSTVEQELSSFTNKAYEQVQSVLHPSFNSNKFSNILKALDVKCQVIDNISTLLKDCIIEPQVCVQPAIKNGVRANEMQPLLKTHVLKFGPMLQNGLIASSIAKAVQVLGATLSPPQIKHFLVSQPAVVQQDKVICNISPSNNSTVQTTSSSGHVQAEEKEQGVVSEEESEPDALILPPAVIQSPEIKSEPPQLLLPPIQAIFPEICNPKPKGRTPLIGCGWEEDVQVQHQKQTSSQLLHFLRAKAKNMGSLEVTVMQWSKSTNTSDWPQTASPAIIRPQSYHQFRHIVTDGEVGALAPKTLRADIENQAPVFRVKRVESSGSLTYTCVIATKTELWDIGDIFTGVQQAHSDINPLRNENCQSTVSQVENSCTSNQPTPSALQRSEPERESNSSGTKTQAAGGVAIPEFLIKRFEETEVVVSHVVSPGNFYIQHTDSHTKLQALVTDRWKASSSYAEQNCIPDIGTQVMGWFPKHEQWCRAQVTKICGVSGDNNSTDAETSIKVEVKMLDHGGTACLSLLNIKELTPEVAALPLQALQVSLANVTPVNGTDWSEDAVGWFKAMVQSRTLYARLYPEGSKVTVELFLEKGKLGSMRRGASLSLRLAQNGHAKHSKLKNIGLVKRSTVQLQMRKQDSDWEKYLISCYTQNKQ